jgi:putative endopeptidase
MKRSYPLVCLAITAALAACGSSRAPAPAVPATSAPVAAAPPPAMTLAQTGIVSAWMDPSVDPCADYFSYACGGFVRDAVIPPDRAEWSVGELAVEANEAFLRDVLTQAAKSPGDDPAMKKIGDYYASCMDEEAVDKAGALPIKALLDDLAKVKDAKTLALEVASLHALGIFPLFDIASEQDYVDATQMIAGLDQAGLGLPDRDYYLADDGNMKDVRTFYAGHVGRMFALLGMKAAEVKTAVVDVMRIETSLAKIAQDKVERRDPHKIYHRVDRAGLPGLAKTIPWDVYFLTLGFPGIREISVSDASYFAGVDALMNTEKPAAWRHYLAWQIARAEAKRLSKAFQNEAFALRRKLIGQEQLAPRWKTCVREVDDELGELLARPYVAAKFGGDSRERARQLVRSIHDAMREELGRLGWIDDATRTAALAKLDAINDKVGYPDRWRTYDFAVSRADYAGNAMRGDGFELHRQLAKVGKSVDKAEWDMTPPTVNAYYNPSLNEIVVPAGELQPPYFSRDFYPPVNIGDEGANTIGHELTHAFDDEGSQFDGAGNLRDWWSAETKAKFSSATKCVQDQYSSYDAVPGVKLNGALTSGENIADIGGVKLGYMALQAWRKEHPGERRAVDGFTDEKIFFLAYSQGWCSKETPELLEWLAHSNPHSPPKWRVNGPMADVPAFAQAYECKAGTPMNSGNVCSVW